MKIRLPRSYNDVCYVADNSSQCDDQTLFVVTSLNERFSSDAIGRGAQCITMDTLWSLIDASSLKVIGITGTNGKTTTAAAIYSTLLDLGYGVALQGTRGFFLNDQRQEEKSLTTPMPLGIFANICKAIEAQCDYFVMEVSSHAIVQNRIEGLTFALKILTNITQDHLDFHKTFEAYRDVKNSFFQGEDLKLVNKDEPQALFNPRQGFTYGIEEVATFKVESYSLNDGLAAVVRYGEEVASFYSPLRGFFNLYNLLAAISSVKILTKQPLDAICEALENFGGVSGRMEVVSADPLVIVDFAHTPDGMAKVLDALREKSLIVVFGAGGDRDALKRPLMGSIAAQRARKVVVTSDNPRSEDPQRIIDQILEGIEDQSKVVVEADRQEAIRLALAMQDKNDCVLVLGKGDETFQEIGDQKYHFDDREIIRALLS